MLRNRIKIDLAGENAMPTRPNAEERVLKLEKKAEKLKETSKRDVPLSLVCELLKECEDLWYEFSKIREKDLDLDGLSARISKVMEELRTMLWSQKEKGFKVVCTKKLPELIYLLVLNFKPFWSLYERVVCVIGISTIFYTLTLPVYLMITFSTPPPLVFSEKPSALEFIAISFGFIFAFLIHEFSHAMSVALRGGKIEGIGFEIEDFVGGIVYASGDGFSANPKNLLFFHSVGIGSNFFASLLFFTIGIFCGYRALLWIGTVNGILAVVNAFPASPLDGGKVYEGLMNDVKDGVIKEIFRVLPKGMVIIWVIMFIFKILFP